MNDVPFAEIGAKEVNTLAAENVAGMKGVTSTLTCVEYTPDEVEDTSLLLRVLYPTIW